MKWRRPKISAARDKRNKNDIKKRADPLIESKEKKKISSRKEDKSSKPNETKFGDSIKPVD